MDGRPSAYFAAGVTVGAVLGASLVVIIRTLERKWVLEESRLLLDALSL